MSTDGEDWGPEILRGATEEEAAETVAEALPDMTPEEQAAWAKKLRGNP